MTYRVIVRLEAEREIQEALIGMKSEAKVWGLSLFVLQMLVCQRCSITQRLTR